MYWFFQNLKRDDRERRWFHFRGTIAPRRGLYLSYEIASGPALALEYTHGEAGDDSSSSMIRLGLLFITIYLKFPLPEKVYFQRKCVATWDNNRQFYLVDGRLYGFYFYDWNFCWHFHAKLHQSSSSDPWWMHQYWVFPDLIFGRTEVMKNELFPKGENIRFLLGGKEFVMNEVKWIRYSNFRRRIPYALYHKKWISVDMHIEKPPMYRGKGENSWDQGDDGSFGLGAPWEHATPTYKTLDKDCELAVAQYVAMVRKDIRKRGETTGERGVPENAHFKYIGREIPKNQDCAEGEA